MPEDSRIRVIIVNRNGRDFIESAVDSVLGQTIQAELVIVDNASTDGSAENLETIQRLSVLRSETNPGFGAGINLGARGATSDFLAFLNPDAVASPCWLERVTNLMRHQDIELAGCYIGAGTAYYCTGARWVPWRGAALTEARAEGGHADWLNGCAMVISRASFERLGGFDEAFFLYSEDVDLSLRARAAGMRIAVLQERLVEHEDHGRSTQALGARKAIIAFTSRGRLVAKHVPAAALPIAVLTQGFLAPFAFYRTIAETRLAAKAFLAGFVPAFRERIRTSSIKRGAVKGSAQTRRS